MKRVLYILMLGSVLSMIFNTISAQRRITPVKAVKGTQTRKAEISTERDTTKMVRMTDNTGMVFYVDTVTGEEYRDSTTMKRVVGNLYPRLESVSIGVNLLDPFLRIMGQQYGGIEFSGQLSLYNRFFPTLELGMSKADISPDTQNFTLHSGWAPYARIGMDYNIFYNSNPAYQFRVGLRYGFSAFSFHTDGYSRNDYWGSSMPIEIPSQNSFAGYLDIAFGLKVKIAGPISLGWSLRYRTVINKSSNPYGETLYIPGFGKVSNCLGGTFTLYYTLPLNRKAVSIVQSANND